MDKLKPQPESVRLRIMRKESATPKREKRKEWQPCERCKATENVTFAADPYRAEIHHDNTPCWLCRSCRNMLAEEV